MTTSGFRIDTSALAEVEQIVRDLLDNDAIIISLDTRPAEVDGWDSLANVSILFSIEETLGVELSDDDVAGIETVGDLVEVIDRARRLGTT